MAAAEHFCSSGLFIFNTGFKQWFPNPDLVNIKYIVSWDHTTYSYNLAGGGGGGERLMYTFQKTIF